jgi:hypothetical protein
MRSTRTKVLACLCVAARPGAGVGTLFAGMRRAREWREEEQEQQAYPA